LPDKYKGFVRTICDDKIEFGGDSDVVSGICVGKLIPAIAEHFPNTTTKFVLLPHGLPEVRFFDNVSSMDVRSMVILGLYVTTVFVAKIEGNSKF
jgi:hypothetical protein